MIEFNYNNCVICNNKLSLDLTLNFSIETKYFCNNNSRSESEYKIYLSRDKKINTYILNFIFNNIAYYISGERSINKTNFYQEINNEYVFIFDLPLQQPNLILFKRYISLQSFQ